MVLTQQLVDEDGSIVDSFAAALLPYRILAASVIPLGPCRYSFTAVSSSDMEGRGEVSRAVDGAGVSRGVLFVVVPLAVILVGAVVVFAACAPLVSDRWRRTKQAEAATVGKPGVPVIFADELTDVPGEGRTGGDTDDDEPLPALPPEYRASTTSPAAGGDYKLLLVASSESSDNDDEDVELNRQHQQSSRRQDEPHLSQQQQQQQLIQSSSPSYAGPLLKPAPSYTLAYADRR